MQEWFRVQPAEFYEVTRSTTISRYTKLCGSGTYYERKDGTKTKLCYFCKKPIETHPHCRRCAALIHRRRGVFPGALECRKRLHDKRLCELCAERLKNVETTREQWHTICDMCERGTPVDDARVCPICHKLLCSECYDGHGGKGNE